MPDTPTASPVIANPVIHVEFFGIPRRRAGRESIEVAAACLREALLAASVAVPGLAEVCENGRLRKGFAANLNGRTFITADDSPLADGDHLLILSADFGG